MSDKTQDTRACLIWEGDVPAEQWTQDGKPAGVHMHHCRIVQNGFGVLFCEDAYPNELGDTPNWINAADMGEPDIALIYRFALRWLFDEMTQWHQLADDAETERDAALEKAKSANEFEARVKGLEDKLTHALNRSAQLEAECIDLKQSVEQFNAKEPRKHGGGNFLKPEKKAAVEELLQEGAGIREVARITGVSKNTVAGVRDENGVAPHDNGYRPTEEIEVETTPIVDENHVRKVWRDKIDPSEEIEKESARGKVLEHIHDFGPATRGRLQKMLDMPKSTVDKVCEELTWAGYIEQAVNGSVITFPEPLGCLGTPKWWPKSLVR